MRWHTRAAQNRLNAMAVVAPVEIQALVVVEALPHVVASQVL